MKKLLQLSLYVLNLLFAVHVGIAAQRCGVSCLESVDSLGAALLRSVFVDLGLEHSALEGWHIEEKLK